MLECFLEKFEQTVNQSLSFTLNANHNIKLPAQYDNHRTTEHTKIQLLTMDNNYIVFASLKYCNFSEF